MLRLAMVGIFAVLIMCPRLPAAAFLVPSDAELIDRADLIVVGTVEFSEPVRLRPQVAGFPGGVATRVEIGVSDVLKGEFSSFRIDIHEPGAFFFDEAVIVSGTAEYSEGEKVLLFLQEGDGLYRTWGLRQGKFTISGPAGEELASRTQFTHAWDERSGERHIERLRWAAGFIDYIRALASGIVVHPSYFVRPPELSRPPASQPKSLLESGPAIQPSPTVAPREGIQAMDHVAPSAYVMAGPPRWPIFDTGGTVSFRTSGSQPGYDSEAAARQAASLWTGDPHSNVRLTIAGQTSAGFTRDGINTIVFNSASDVPSGALGFATIYMNAIHTYKGISFYSISEGDVAIRSNLGVSAAVFQDVVTHEVGHALGFRHSNEASPSSTSAVMNSTVSGAFVSSLGSWDREALSHVYTGFVSSCTTAAITLQPSSETISPGQVVTLAVSVTGTSPFTYQWYTGVSGSTASPISGADQSMLSVAPASSTNYWVRVANSCGQADSQTATVTVRPTPVTSLYTLTPCRIIDTRTIGSPLAAHSVRRVQAAGTCGVPVGTKALAANITVVEPFRAGHLTMYPAGITTPRTSTINFEAGRTLANHLLVSVSSEGTASFDVFNGAPVAVHFIVDVYGIFQ
jgi:hypothetical protein